MKIHRILVIALLTVFAGSSIDYFFKLESGIGLTALFQLRGVRKPPENIVIVAMDESSETELGMSMDLTRWRGFHPQVIQQLSQQGAALIVFDLQFLQADPEHDAGFAAAIAQAGNVIFTDCVQKFRKGTEDFFGREECSDQHKQPIITKDKTQQSELSQQMITMRSIPPNTIFTDNLLDHAAYYLNNDELNNSIKESWLFFDLLAEAPSLPLVTWSHYLQINGQLVIDEKDLLLSHWLTEQRQRCLADPEHAELTATKTQVLPLRAIICGGDSRFLDFYGSAKTFRIESYSDVYQGKVNNLAGKIILIGKLNRQYSPGKTDAFETPFSSNQTNKTMGVEIIATEVANLMENRNINMANPAILNYLMYGLLIAFLLNKYRDFTAISICLILSSSYSALSLWCFDRFCLWLPVAIPLLIQLPLSYLLTLAWSRKDLINDSQHLVNFDPITNLPNRNFLVNYLQNDKIHRPNNASFHGLLLIDLDNFKKIIDTQGHHQGDLMLQQVAERLKTFVCQQDIVTRVGGDEFMLLLNNVSKHEQTALQKLDKMAQKILAAFSQPFMLNAINYHCSASLGMTLFKSQQASVDELMKQADIALNHAKADGGNVWCIFEPSMASVLHRKAFLESHLRQALVENQFILYYQPQIAHDGKIKGAEVLLRWQHPNLGLISPGEFIPIAEESGLIIPLGYWILETACRQLAIWANDRKMAEIMLAVNVSACQFRQADFVDNLMAICGKTGAKPTLLKLELTESMLLENYQDIIEKMTQLKAKGICFSLDDFGTGFSSLSYLKRLPLDQLKLDQSFVRDMILNQNAAVISKSIIDLGINLGLDVIAEGVETKEQINFLSNLGCHHYQGYFFGRPVPIEPFEQLFRS